MDWSQLTSQPWFHRLTRVWKRWGWTALTGLFAVICLSAGWIASRGTEPRVRMAFVLLALTFFLYGFFRYFFAIAAFSAAHRATEKKRIHKPPPRVTLIVLYFCIGVASTVSLIALWWWRNS